MGKHTIVLNTNVVQLIRLAEGMHYFNPKFVKTLFSFMRIPLTEVRQGWRIEVGWMVTKKRLETHS